MSATELDLVLSPRQLRRQRRRESLRRMLGEFVHHRGGVAGVALLGAFVLMALTAGLLFPRSMLDIASTVNNPDWHPPDLQFLLGTDANGRSVIAQLFWGARTSLAVGLAATFVAVALGASVGIASGHYRNAMGVVLERFTDWFLVIPWLPLAIVVITLLGGGLGVIIIVIGITSWAGTARLVRAQTLSIEGRPYMERASVLGVGHTQQMARHVLPNVLPLILANATLTVSIAILTETTLSFLGLGDPAHPSWGTMLDDANSSAAMINGAWWWVLPPGICIVLVVLSFTLIGRALEVIFNPRLSQDLP
jgi:peptide/nickel transport system permease protein